MNEKNITAGDFRKLLEEIVREIGPLEVAVDRGEIETYCELTGHDFSMYIEANRAPQGYFMTLTAPLFSRFFTTAGARLIPKIVKGVIHTSSKVEYFRPFEIGRRYLAKVEMGAVVEKSGNSGDYFAADIEFVVSDEKGQKVALDIHQFFLRT